MELAQNGEKKPFNPFYNLGVEDKGEKIKPLKEDKDFKGFDKTEDKVTNLKDEIRNNTGYR